VALDATKVVSGDGSCVRVWSHGSGRRIATLTGHPGRLSAVAFDSETLISGCTGGVVRLWSMDELRVTKSVRQHVGGVSAVAVLNGVPISAGEEGDICLWDAAAGSGAAPILSLVADGPVVALDGSSTSGHLMSAVAREVDGWDMSSAQRVLTLVPPPPQAAGPEAAAAAYAAPGAGSGFSCVSTGGNLVAASRAGEVVLWDMRSAEVVGSIACSGPSSGAEAAAPPCVGVQLDDYKLVTGWAGANALSVYDVRSLGGSQHRANWQQPVLTFEADARITCFKVRSVLVVVGWGSLGAACLEGGEARLLHVDERFVLLRALI